MMKHNSSFKIFLASLGISAALGATKLEASWVGAISPFLTGGAKSLGDVAGKSSKLVAAKVIASASDAAAKGAVNGVIDGALIKKSFDSQMTAFVLDSKGITWSRTDLDALLKEVVADDSMCGRAMCQSVLGFSPSETQSVLENMVTKLEGALETNNAAIRGYNDKLKLLDPSEPDYELAVKRRDELITQKSSISSALTKLDNALLDDTKWISELLNCRY